VEQHHCRADKCGTLLLHIRSRDTLIIFFTLQSSKEQVEKHDRLRGLISNVQKHLSEGDDALRGDMGILEKLLVPSNIFRTAFVSFFFCWKEEWQASAQKCKDEQMSNTAKIQVQSHTDEVWLICALFVQVQADMITDLKKVDVIAASHNDVTHSH